MSVFVLFFMWLAALRRGRLTMAEAGMSIVLWVVAWLDECEGLTMDDVRRLHGWLDWAAWAARRADPAACRSAQIGRGDLSLNALVTRLTALGRILMHAPARPPRRRLRVLRKPARRALLRPARAFAPRPRARCRAPPARAPTAP